MLAMLGLQHANPHVRINFKAMGREVCARYKAGETGEILLAQSQASVHETAGTQADSLQPVIPMNETDIAAMPIESIETKEAVVDDEETQDHKVLQTTANDIHCTQQS